MTIVGIESAEVRWVNSASPDGGPNGTAPVIDTSVSRSGAASIRCDGGTSATSFTNLITGNATPGLFPLGGNYLWSLRWFRAGALPATSATIFQMYTSAGPYVKLTSAGDLELWAGTSSANDRLIGSLAAGIAVNQWFAVLVERKRVASTATNELRAWYCTEDPQADTLIGESSTMTEVEVNSAAGSNAAYPDRAGWVTAPGLTASLWLDDGLIRASAGTGTWAKKPSPRTKVVRLTAQRVITNTSNQWHTCKSTTYSQADTIAAANALPTAAHADSTTDGTAHQHRNTSAASTGAPSILELEYSSYGRMGIPGHVIVGNGGAGRQAIGDATAHTRIAQGQYVGQGLATVRLSLLKVGTPTDNLVVEVQTDSAGVPSGTVLASATIAGATLTTSLADYDVDLTCDIGLGVKSWIVLSRSGSVDASNYYRVQTSATASVYADGGTAAHNGTSWGSVDATAAWVFSAFNAGGQAFVSNLFGIFWQGEAVTTGTKTGTYKFSKPDQGTAATFTYNDSGTACGTFNTGWVLNTSAFGAATLFTGPGTPAMSDAVRYLFSKTDTGTRAVLVAGGPVILAEYSEPLAGWNQVIKTADSTVWWAKYLPHRTQVVSFPSGVETWQVVDAGQWIVTADPLPDDGDLAALSVIADDTLKAGYTLG